MQRVRLTAIPRLFYMSQLVTVEDLTAIPRLFYMSQPATVNDLIANPRLFYMSQLATVNDLIANPELPYMGQLLHGDVLTSNHVISRVSQWYLEISMTAFPISCTWVNSRCNKLIISDRGIIINTY